ncbi:putative disease resistance RPP13-like protein 3 [Setaria italica]|uniref:NB-ARC domain-containing protein n=1 Tax=Setaria italica TaxID=4555 RepID=K3Z3C3_SETIT|nr:putative disease resistance RPP13-like protein 3 [Setaria italica]
MDLVTGAVGSLASKLLQLLVEEYKLQTTGLKKQVQSLSAELESIHPFLNKVANVPWYLLDEQIKVWAREVRDKCYDVEDVFDTLLVQFEGPETADPSRLKRAMHKMGDLFAKVKARHDIANDIEDIMRQLEEVAERRNRYKIDDSIEVKPASKTIDPRLSALYTKPSQLVGINEPRDALIEMLSIGGQEKKIVSIVGSGGLGKTTLAMAVYDKLTKINGRFDCGAFVPVGPNPDIKKTLRDILIDLIKTSNMINAFDNRRLSLLGDLKELDEKQLIDSLREHLEGKRYFIVLDDIWEKKTWRFVEPAFVDGKCGSRILTTTRNSEVSKEIGEVYKLDELSDKNSKKLFYSLTFGGEEKRPCSDNLDMVSDTIIHKCRGLPLAIITIAGVLARKPIEEWSDVYNSIGFGPDENEVEDMKKILSFSYYDLPSHLRTCLLYLSIFQEEYFIDKRELILRWIAEGFIYEERGKAFFDVGDSYLRELMNRNLVIPTEEKSSGLLRGCRVHDKLLRLIRQLSTEENFAVVLDKDQRSSVAQVKVRRLALRTLTEETNYNKDDLARVRSFNAIICFTKLIPPVCSFKVLRVLVLEYCIGMEGYPIKHIAKLLHLRYIALSHTPVRKLPKEIGNLKFLQTLLLDDTGIKELPASVRLLKQLMCLRADEKTRVPDWIGEMTSLVELEMYHELLPNFLLREAPRVQEQEMHSGADNKCSTRKFVKELGKLINLRVLKSGIKLQDQEEGRDFLASLSKLHKIQDISMLLTAYLEMDVGREPSFALSSSLRTLQLLNVHFSKVPAWMNGQRLPNLCQLKVLVSNTDEQDLRILGTLQKLRHLVLMDIRYHKLKLTICGCGGFQNLRFLHLGGSPLQFVPGAMPRLEDITFSVNVFELVDANISFDFGLENLSSLQSVTVGVHCADACLREVEEAEAAIRHAVDIHSKHPSLLVKRMDEDKMGTVDADSREVSRLMYKMLRDSTLSEQIKKLNDQIDVQNNCNSTLYSQAQEMAHSIPEGHPSIAKQIQWSSVTLLEMVALRKQLADTFQTINDTSDPDQLMQHIKLQERLFELYKVENKRMAAIVEELKAELKISDNVADAEEHGGL